MIDVQNNASLITGSTADTRHAHFVEIVSEEITCLAQSIISLMG